MMKNRFQNELPPSSVKGRFLLVVFTTIGCGQAALGRLCWNCSGHSSTRSLGLGCREHPVEWGETYWICWRLYFAMFPLENQAFGNFYEGDSSFLRAILRKSKLAILYFNILKNWRGIVWQFEYWVVATGQFLEGILGRHTLLREKTVPLEFPATLW